MTSPNAALLKILDPASQKPRDLPVLRLGFRPFYLVAALFAALSIPAWMLVFLGYLPWTAAVPPLLWHAHEMLLGFASAVIIGFLLTAGKAWTQLPTPRGAPLGALVLLWVAARLAALWGPYPVYVVLDVSLLPIVALVLARLLRQAGNTRNLPLVGLLVALSVANLAFHLSVMGVLHAEPLRTLYAALALVVMIECVMAGRIIPGFTMSALPGLKIAPRPWLDTSTLVCTALALAAWVLQAPAWLGATLLWTAAALHVLRQWRWQPWRTFARPILWVLHAAYVWIAIGLALLGAAQWSWVSHSAGVHALAVGATGGLIIGMVTRTARGHTGRTLNASRTEVFAYVLIAFAAVVRVFMPLLAPGLYAMALVIAAAAWSVAFALYLWVYTPWLMQTRLDGRDG